MAWRWSNNDLWCSMMVGGGLSAANDGLTVVNGDLIVVGGSPTAVSGGSALVGNNTIVAGSDPTMASSSSTLVGRFDGLAMVNDNMCWFGSCDGCSRFKVLRQLSLFIFINIPFP